MSQTTQLNATLLLLPYLSNLAARLLKGKAGMMMVKAKAAWQLHHHCQIS
jgi:hypothetical protein